MGVARRADAAMSGRTSSAYLADGKWRRSTARPLRGPRRRIALDGAPAENLDGDAKDLEVEQLAVRKAAKKTVEAAAPAVVNPKHAAAPAPPTKTPEHLRDRVRAALSGGHA